ncbi:MAG: hypothetical protein DLM61_07350 [Pseudonocardiales bacterium]|nr:MAG: hypothetical protein DLM61_07350 [Pseudonocardiales bacterium]
MGRLPRLDHRWFDLVAPRGEPDPVLPRIRAVAAGRVVRGGDALRSVSAPHLLGDRPVRMALRRLAREDLVFVPISGPPAIAPRGRRLLELADGEVATAPED